MLDATISDLPAFATQARHSVSGLSSGAFMTVQLHVAHSASFIGAGVIAGGPYRAAQSFRATPTVPTSNILNALYVAMTPLTPEVAPDVDRLIELARETPRIDDLAHLAGQRVYIFTGTEDRVVNQFAVAKTRDFYAALGVSGDAVAYVDDVPAGHSIITMNPEDSPLGVNRPPFINRGDFVQSHQILDHIYPGSKPPAAEASGKLLRFEQSAFLGDAPERASMAPFGYAYIPSAVAAGDAPALGVHVVLHGCKQGYAFVDFVDGRRDIANQPPFGARYVRTTGYAEWGEANNLIVLFPQADGRDDNFVQNPDGCWDWWGYSAEDSDDPDFYTQDAVQIAAIHRMLTHLASG